MYGTTHSFQSIHTIRQNHVKEILIGATFSSKVFHKNLHYLLSIHQCLQLSPISNPNPRNHQLWNFRCGLLFRIFRIKFTIHFTIPSNRRIPFSDGGLVAYKIKTFPFHLLTPAYVDIGFCFNRGLGLDMSVRVANLRCSRELGWSNIFVWCHLTHIPRRFL